MEQVKEEQTGEVEAAVPNDVEIKVPLEVIQADMLTMVADPIQMPLNGRGDNRQKEILFTVDTVNIPMTEWQKSSELLADDGHFSQADAELTEELQAMTTAEWSFLNETVSTQHQPAPDDLRHLLNRKKEPLIRLSVRMKPDGRNIQVTSGNIDNYMSSLI